MLNDLGLGFALGQRVTVVGTDHEEFNATVRAIMFDTDGITVRISYWDASGTRKVEWVYADEIKAKAKVTA